MRIRAKVWKKRKLTTKRDEIKLRIYNVILANIKIKKEKIYAMYPIQWRNIVDGAIADLKKEDYIIIKDDWIIRKAKGKLEMPL